MRQALRCPEQMLLELTLCSVFRHHSHEGRRCEGEAHDAEESQHSVPEDERLLQFKGLSIAHSELYGEYADDVAGNALQKEWLRIAKPLAGLMEVVVGEANVHRRGHGQSNSESNH